MSTNNLSLTLGPGRKKVEGVGGWGDWHKEKETESIRTKCPAQRGENAKDGQLRRQRDGEVNKTERDQDPEENTVSSQSFRSITLCIFPRKQPSKMKFCREHKACNSS